MLALEEGLLRGEELFLEVELYQGGELCPKVGQDKELPQLVEGTARKELHKAREGAEVPRARGVFGRAEKKHKAGGLPYPEGVPGEVPRSEEPAQVGNKEGAAPEEAWSSQASPAPCSCPT